MDLDNIKIEDLLTPEQLIDYKQYMEYCDANINGFGLPITIENDNEYRSSLESTLSKYKEYVAKKSAFNKDNVLLQGINYVTETILRAIDDYLCGKIKSAQENIYGILEKRCNNPFFVRELDKNYAFRGIAPFHELQRCNNDYTNLLNSELSFFRARQSKSILSTTKDVSYIPLNKRELVGVGRFSIAGIPCLYLGTTSYCCWLELGRPPRNEFFCSSFKCTENGKHLKVFNMTISEGLINGIFHRPSEHNDSIQHNLQREMMMLFPLVIATAYHVKQLNRNFKSEYIVSQLIMQCLHDLNIDGIAYLSKQSYSDFEYPHNVNLAIPIYNTNGSNINNCFSVSKPLSLELYSLLNGNIADNDIRSYINTNFDKGFNGQVNPGISIPYSSTLFSSFDDFLVNQQHIQL